MQLSSRQIEIIEAAALRIDEYGIQNLTTKTLAQDIGISEPALYRHFAGKNDILLTLLQYFKHQLQQRLLLLDTKASAAVTLKQIFQQQFQIFTENPAIVSVIFAESIFQFNPELSQKVKEIMILMSETVENNIVLGQKQGEYRSTLSPKATVTIITGAMRMAVLKWKLSKHQSDLNQDGQAVLDGLFKLLLK
ncbi:MAG: TetR/AcrR family transcriptional regulator [Fibrobacter sp.]|nr:TetR/AcrR family transcriptional regulator [Fibrobacter sp.]